MSMAPLGNPTEEHAPPLTSRTVEITLDSSLLSRLPRGSDTVAWVSDGAEGLVGWGQAARLSVSGPERFSRAQRWWASQAAQAHVDDEVRIPGTGPVAFTSFAFDPADPTDSVVVVPAIVLGRREGRAWLTVVGTSRRDTASLLSTAVSELGRPMSVPDVPIDVAYSSGALSVPAWQHAVAEAVRRIDDGELDKVVLARDVSVMCAADVDVRHLLQRLSVAYPSCWTFHVDGLVGATPEMLVRRTGDCVTSRVLAGTMRRSSDTERDAGLASALLESAKDHAEHSYAVQSVAAALAAHCTDLVVPAAPSLLRLANVQHLATDVTGRLADSSSVLALAASLHPTAAVCGTPTERARSVIRELEGMSRGRYAGPVGWVDAHGDGEMGIALRCASVSGPSLRLYAGCGLVSGSDPEAELAESQAKLVAMRDALA